MDDFNDSVNGIKLLLFNAVDSEESGNKLETYKKYIKGLSALFNVLDKDLEDCSPRDDPRALKAIGVKHVSMLKSARNSIKRSIIQLESSPEGSKPLRASLNSFEGPVSAIPMDIKSLPNKKSIDILLSEKPMNPIDSAKFNLQNAVNNTKRLLATQKLSASQRISVQLQLNRMIEETLSIARKREDYICKEKTSDLELLQEKINSDICRYSILKSDPDLIQLYRSSLLFYHHILKDSKWYELAKLDRCPESSCLLFILRMNDNHPIVQYIDKIIETLLLCKTDKENTYNVLNEIKKFIEKIQNLSMACCLIGNINVNERNFNSSQILYGLLCDFIFKKVAVVNYIYDFLFISDEDNTNQFNKNVLLVEEKSAVSTILPDKFSKHPDIIGILDNQVSEFSNLRAIYNPLERTTKLCQIIRDMMSIITENNPKVEIGADELVPILSYMMVKFGNAELYLHVKYLEILMPPDYMIGIEGYILVSVCCAMAFCTSNNFERYLTTKK